MDFIKRRRSLMMKKTKSISTLSVGRWSIFQNYMKLITGKKMIKRIKEMSNTVEEGTYKQG